MELSSEKAGKLKLQLGSFLFLENPCLSFLPQQCQFWQHKTDVNWTPKFQFWCVPLSSCCSSYVLLVFPRVGVAGRAGSKLDWLNRSGGFLIRCILSRPTASTMYFPYHLLPRPETIRKVPLWPPLCAQQHQWCISVTTLHRVQCTRTAPYPQGFCNPSLAAAEEASYGGFLAALHNLLWVIFLHNFGGIVLFGLVLQNHQNSMRSINQYIFRGFHHTFWFSRNI